MLRQIIIWIVSFLLICLFALRPLVDYDLWWHLAVGRFIWETKTIPALDILTFSWPSFPYVYHSWLSEVFIYLIYQKFSFWGVSFFYVGITALGIMFLLRTFKSMIFFLPVILYIVHTRTQVVSFVGLALIFHGYSKYQQSHKLRLIDYLCIGILFILWANMHGGFFLGLLFLGAVVGIELVFQWRKQAADWKHQISKVLFLFPISLAASLINPYGLRALTSAVDTGVALAGSTVNLDWAPLFWGDKASQLVGLILTGMLALVLIKSLSSIPIKLLAIVFFSLSLLSRRFVLPLAVILLPEVSRYLERFGSKYIQSKFSPVYFASIVFVLVWVLSWVSQLSLMPQLYSSDIAFAQVSSRVVLPIGALSYFRANGHPEQLFTDANWGAYLYWHFPTSKFFADGRVDTFRTDKKSLLREYLILVNAQTGWEKLLRQYNIDLVLAPRRAQWPLVTVLLENLGWRTVYQNEISQLIQRF